MANRDFLTTLLYARDSRWVGKIAYYFLKTFGVEIPRSVKIGRDCLLVHGAFGTVLHPNTVIGDRVKIYPGVTIGRADIYREADESEFRGVRIESEVILSPGAKVLGQAGVLTMGKGSVLGANAVLLKSTGEGEIWAGIPARKVGQRQGF